MEGPKLLPMIQTVRLLLRRWQPSDLEPFSRMNADPRVMEFFPACLSTEESNGLLARFEQHFCDHGFGFYAAELREERTFIGFIGLAVPRFKTHFTPCVEIGWRLAVDHWGRGLATEGALGVVSEAFDSFMLDEIVSFAVPANIRSRRVMERIGMTRNPADDFDHPNLPAGHPLRRHVLYRLARPK
jgi:RimJ/RimL family protein N-acetyltransferase